MDYFGLGRIISESVGSFQTPSLSDDSDSFGLDRNSSDFVGLIRNPDRNLPIYELQNHAKVRKFFMKSENFL